MLLKAFSLGQNFPNPLTSVTTIEYAVAKPCQVSVGVYDVTGRLIETLADGRHQPGLCSTTWNGRDSSGNKVPSGVYFYRLSATRQGGSASGGRAGDFTATKQLVVLR